ncbi:hypothetical protein GCM10018793_01580 [Streptomyces sulfonofaciens]|uniref:NodB homology domain-containing protein n=1 Tax=Streptomyces sulfonofaciens TaxID=68272 RepID=A0A919FPK5_9ACTN|nr:hypothetical protein GCM10018793_01580 [Streptomyces sulfonofaciens]
MTVGGAAADGGGGPSRRFLFRAALVTAGLTAAGALLGLGRDRALAHLFGAGRDTDAFLVAWTVPEVAATLLIEDGMAFVLVPAFSLALARRRTGARGPDPVRALVAASLPRVLLGLGVAGALLCAGAPLLVRLLAPGLPEPGLAVDCTRFTATCAVSFGLAGYCSAALRAHRSFAVPAAIYVVHNLAIVAAVFAFGGRLGVRAAALGVACGGCLMVAVQAPALWRHLRGGRPPEGTEAARTPTYRDPASPARARTVATAGPGGSRGPRTVPSAAYGPPAAHVHAGSGAGAAGAAEATKASEAGQSERAGQAVRVQRAVHDGHAEQPKGAGQSGRSGRAGEAEQVGRAGRAGVEGGLVACVLMFALCRQSQVLVERYLASSLPPGAISHLNYAQKVAQVPMALSLMLCTVTFPVVARALAEGDTARARDRMERDLLLAGCVVLLGAAALVACAPALLELLFQQGAFTARDTAATAGVLRVYALGLLGHTLVGALVRCHFSAGRRTWYPLAAMATGAVATAVLGAWGAGPWGARGIAAANAAGITLTALLLLIGGRGPGRGPGAGAGHERRPGRPRHGGRYGTSRPTAPAARAVPVRTRRVLTGLTGQLAAAVLAAGAGLCCAGWAHGAPATVAAACAATAAVYGLVLAALHPGDVTPILRTALRHARLGARSPAPRTARLSRRGAGSPARGFPARSRRGHPRHAGAPARRTRAPRGRTGVPAAPAATGRTRRTRPIPAPPVIPSRPSPPSSSSSSPSSPPASAPSPPSPATPPSTPAPPSPPSPESTSMSADTRAVTPPPRKPSAGRRRPARAIWWPSGAPPWVAMYHSVADRTEDPHRITVTPGRLDAQLRLLRRQGLRGVSVAELLAARSAGRDRNLVGLTFDDGYRDFTEHALPLLRKHACTATVFVLAGRLGGANTWEAHGPRKPLLDADGIRRAADAGMEIASHGLTHTDLTRADEALRHAELVHSRALLGELTGRAVRGFCYPYGAVDRDTADAVRRAGYAYACAIAPGPLAGVFALPRVYVGQHDTGARLTAKRLLAPLRRPLPAPAPPAAPESRAARGGAASPAPAPPGAGSAPGGPGQSGEPVPAAPVPSAHPGEAP